MSYQLLLGKSVTDLSNGGIAYSEPMECTSATSGNR